MPHRASASTEDILLACVMADGCLPQKPRTDVDDATFRNALKIMADLCARHTP